MFNILEAYDRHSGRRSQHFLPVFTKLLYKPRSNESSTADYCDFHGGSFGLK